MQSKLAALGTGHEHESDLPDEITDFVLLMKPQRVACAITVARSSATVAGLVSNWLQLAEHRAGVEA